MNKVLKKIRLFFVGFFTNPNATKSISHETSILDTINILGNSTLITIGNNVSIGTNVTMAANASIIVGDDTMIAINVVFHTSTHNYNNHPMWIERVDRPINVGKHVWIGIGVIICPGVVIGDYAVIGAGSVVVSNIPSKAIVAGNPARIIKYRNTTDLIFEEQVNKLPRDSFITKKGYLNSKNMCKEKK